MSTLPPNDDLLWSMATICQKLGGISDDTAQRLMKRGEFRKVKQGAYTYALAREVRAYAERLADKTDQNNAA